MDRLSDGMSLKLHADNDIAIEPREYAEESLDRHLAKSSAQELGQIGLPDADDPRGFALIEAGLIEPHIVLCRYNRI